MGQKRLTFREDGTFKIVQFTDVHLIDGSGEEKDQRTLALMKDIVKREQPDLIVYTGDLIFSERAGEPAEAFRSVIGVAEAAGIPYGVVYGNHDSEQGVTRAELQTILEERELSLSKAGPADIHGTGNYVLTVQRSSGTGEAAVLYFVDSGEYASPSVGGYAWLHPDQVNWYSAQSSRISALNKGPLPALAFLHIPLPEYREAALKGEILGTKGEEVCCPVINSGMFAAMLDGGDVMGVFAGHDHDNDYMAAHHGITLAYGRVTGWNTYGALQRGARVIELREDAFSFRTWIRLEDGSVVNEAKAAMEKTGEVSGRI
ncbi:metallophosphoesterase [Paenibacillus oryzae]|uniref:Metallophosphoesterase n=1 Tax=Paenibacillus oryzae TaxID=1844972 RepID=A0A1A5YQV1_9BACL|nr:metallophosphoesterase family protein [Paenibacillus oryzae]OBR67953.1 metallophosphoesterase [Paenibacillus oryzae]